MKYHIEFFELTASPTPDVSDAFQALTDLVTSQTDAAKVDGFMRELWKLKADPRVICGQFRKFRESDLPEIGRLGDEAEEIELQEGEGLIEKNFFALYKHQSLLAWHRNFHASRPAQLAKMLSKLLGTTVEALPLVQSDGLMRLMKSDVVMRSLELSIPRPRGSEYYPENDFSQHLFDALGAADGDRIRVSITTNANINDSPRLSGRMKQALKELVKNQAVTRAKVEAIEDGLMRPIDLIADHIGSSQEIEHEGRYPTARAMYEAIDGAVDEQREAIDAVLGTGGHRID